MNARSYKDILTKSGHIYHTFFSPPDILPTILFVHGFPSTAYDWRHQVAFFIAAGYGVIAPDLLGHGGSSKPSQIAHYAPSKITADLIDVIDHCDVDEVAVVGHDWGSILATRLGQYHPDRFVAFAFVASGFCPPLPGFDLELTLSAQVKAKNAELFAYWLFLGEERAKDVVDAHLESLLTLWYTSDPELWKTVLTRRDQLEPWLKSDKKAASFLSTEDKARMLADWKKAGGLGAALKWFQVMKSGLIASDDQAIKDKASIPHPMIFMGCTKDAVCIAEPSEGIMREVCPHGKSQMFEAGHWLQLEQPEKLNRALLDWIRDSVPA